MKELTRTVFSTLSLMAVVASSVAAPAVLPKIYVSTNTMKASEVSGAPRLKADGTWFLGENSPDMDLAKWKTVCAAIGTSTFVAEDGGISPSYLMNEQLTPRIRIRNSTGLLVSVPANGEQLIANVPLSRRTDNEIFRYRFAPSSGTTPVVPSLLDFPKSGQELLLQSYGGAWVQAPGGGGDFLRAVPGSPTFWERLGIQKRSSGDATLRSGDKFAMQTWNGFFGGGSYVSADLYQGSRLLPNRPNIGEWEQFSISYPCEYVTASQIARVTHELAYHEFSDAAPGAYEYTLNGANIDEVARRTPGSKTMVLGRSFVDLSHAPGILPTLRQQILNAVNNGNCKGVTWEITAGGTITGELLNGFDAVRARGKECFVMIAPREYSKNYASDLKRTISQLKASRWYGSLQFVLTNYRTSTTEVPFLGGSNSVEGALAWLKANR